MEEKPCRKTLAIESVCCLLFFLLSGIPEAASSSDPSSILFNSSSSSPRFLKRILLGILLGSFTGAVASIIFLFSIRLFLLFADRTPILKGPVIFSPKIPPKSLRLVFPRSDESPQMLGSSPNGKYFKLSLNGEASVAVKLLESSFSTEPKSCSWKRRAQRELERLAKVSHRNVMSLRAYVRDHDRLSLVYDYVSGGSLEDAMKRVRLNQLRLGWELRRRVAVGIAKGLKYLHFELVPRILHYNLKPSNVLLDEGLEPRLGDLGLAGLVVAAVDASLSSCYVAPECFQSCRYTDKSDIYSFGVILSLLLTGKDPCDAFFMEEGGRGGLVPWLRHLQQVGEAGNALDKGLLGEGEEEEMLMAIRIALVCLSDLPADRPSSDELEAMLSQLQSF